MARETPRRRPVVQPEAPLRPMLDPSGSANPSIASARNAVRHRIRDGVPSLDTTPVPFSLVRLEDLSDQLNSATPSLVIFQCRYADVPTGRYMNAQVVPGSLVAYVDGVWTPVSPTVDVDQNGNFTLPTAPTTRLLITYAYQYMSDGELDQFIDEARQWLREYTTVSTVPDGLVPALISYASARALNALRRTANLARVHAGDSEVDWSSLAKEYGAEATDAYKTATDERTVFYTQGPEALDPLAVDVSAVDFGGPYTPER